MQIKLAHFAHPKAGTELSDYEDAAFPLASPASKLHAFRIAVADGATESSFAQLWAQLLTTAFAERRLWTRRRSLTEQLVPLQRVWQEFVAQKPLPWYAEEKVRSGAFAALLGVEFSARGRWHAWAVGDSCLFHVRASQLLAAFPMTTASAFNSRPLLIGSHLRHHAEAAQATRRRVGTWLSGDQFFLMTDALAAWFLMDHTRGMAEISALPTDDALAFAAWVDALRSSKELRNDDTTLLRMTVW